MLSISSKQQQYMLDARQYTDTVGAGGLSISSQGWNCGANGNKTCSNAYYDVSVTLQAGPPPGFTVVGTPKDTQVSDGILSYAHTGTKTRMVSGTDKGW